MRHTLHIGDNLAILPTLPDNSVDAIVTDPPYGLVFMGKDWDKDVPGPATWRECLRVLKPGGHLLAFAGTRTQHKMATAIELAGFEIRDMIAWVYGSGFPKSLDVSKTIDKMDASEEQNRRRIRFTAWVRSTGITSRQIDEATDTNMGGHYTTAASQPAIMTREHLEACRHLLGEVPDWVEREADVRSVESRNMAEREVVGVQKNAMSGWDIDGGTKFSDRNITAPATEAARKWHGWGTALKPALEPITVARKPLDGTVADNVLRHGTGAINVDACRVEHNEDLSIERNPKAMDTKGQGWGFKSVSRGNQGRWPANLIHDGSQEVLDLFPQSKVGKETKPRGKGGIWSPSTGSPAGPQYGDSGTAARFFYCPKANKRDRDEGCEHLPTQEKPAHMRTANGEGEASMTDGFQPTQRKNTHPTVKPTELMRYLVRLITPPGGTVLDPFTGSGSTGKAAILEGFNFIGIELSSEYAAIAEARIRAAYKEPD